MIYCLLLATFSIMFHDRMRLMAKMLKANRA